MTDRHQQKPYPLRMPDELREKLETAAQDGARSLHAEIVSRLADSFYGARELEDKLVVMQFVLHMATTHIKDQEIVDSINKVRKSLANYKDGDEFPPSGQKAMERLVQMTRTVEEAAKANSQDPFPATAKPAAPQKASTAKPHPQKGIPVAEVAARREAEGMPPLKGWPKEEK